MLRFGLLVRQNKHCEGVWALGNCVYMFHYFGETGKAKSQKYQKLYNVALSPFKAIFWIYKSFSEDMLNA